MYKKSNFEGNLTIYTQASLSFLFESLEKKNVAKIHSMYIFIK